MAEEGREGKKTKKRHYLNRNKMQKWTTAKHNLCILYRVHSKLGQCCTAAFKCVSSWTKSKGLKFELRNCCLGWGFYPWTKRDHNFLMGQDKITGGLQCQTYEQGGWQVPGTCVSLPADTELWYLSCAHSCCNATSFCIKKSVFTNLVAPSSHTNCCSIPTLCPCCHLHPREAQVPLTKLFTIKPFGFRPWGQEDDSSYIHL